MRPTAPGSGRGPRLHPARRGARYRQTCRYRRGGDETDAAGDTSSDDGAGNAQGKLDPTPVITHRQEQGGRLREGGPQALTAPPRGDDGEPRRGPPGRRPPRRGSRRGGGRRGGPAGARRPPGRGATGDRAAARRSRSTSMCSATPRIPGATPDPAATARSIASGLLMRSGSTTTCPGCAPLGSRWSTVRCQMPAKGDHGNITADLAAETGDRDLRPVGERVPLRQDDAEQHRAEDDAVEVTVLLRPVPDDRCIGPPLPDRLDGVVPRAGRHEDLDARDGEAHRSQRAVEDPVGHGADPQGHLLPAPSPCGSHVLAGPVDLGQDHPRPLRQDAPRRRQLGSAWSAIEERDAQVPLQRTDLLRERRSGDVQPARGSGEAPLLGHGEEVPELAQVHRTRYRRRQGPGGRGVRPGLTGLWFYVTAHAVDRRVPRYDYLVGVLPRPVEQPVRSWPGSARSRGVPGGTTCARTRPVNCCWPRPLPRPAPRPSARRPCSRSSAGSSRSTVHSWRSPTRWATATTPW